MAGIRLIQLDPPVPLRVVPGAGWEGPTGAAMAVGWFQESIDHSLTFVCVMDLTGEVWQVEQTNVRFRRNITWGRNPQQEKREQSNGS